MQQLNWSKCQGEVWCKLNFVNLDHQHFNGVEGVYIIWHGGKNPHVVYVGQGKIRDRLRAHRNDAEIQSYAPSGLFVTWASVSVQFRDGVERYLANFWGPKVGSHPNVPPIEANSPW